MDKAKELKSKVPIVLEKITVDEAIGMVRGCGIRNVSLIQYPREPGNNKLRFYIEEIPG